jgi:hypothetical protein
MPVTSSSLLRGFAMFVLANFLVGCATQSGYDVLLHEMMGSSEPDVIRVWGPPGSIQDRDGIRILTYTRGSASAPGSGRTYNAMSPTGGGVVLILAGGTPGGTVGPWCTTRVFITDGRVSRYAYEGNDCRA